MKPLFYMWILFSVFLLTGCKTHKVTRSTGKYSYGWNMGLEGVRFSDYSLADSLIRQWQRQLTGHILIWSPPDSAGKQYIQVEIDLRSDETSQTDQYVSVVATDTTQVSAKVKHTGAGEVFHHQETIRDSRPFSRTVIITFCVLALIALFLYRKKKRDVMG